MRMWKLPLIYMFNSAQKNGVRSDFPDSPHSLSLRQTQKLVAFFPAAKQQGEENRPHSTFIKGSSVSLPSQDVSICIYICFKAHPFPRLRDRRTYFTCPPARLCSKYLAPIREHFRGSRAVGKQSLWEKESSSPLVWEGGIQGSGHTERARLVAKRLPPNDLKNKKWIVLKRVEEAKELFICIQTMFNFNI